MAYSSAAMSLRFAIYTPEGELLDWTIAATERAAWRRFIETEAGWSDWACMQAVLKGYSVREFAPPPLPKPAPRPLGVSQRWFAPVVRLFWWRR